jgi:hypothetical protein
MFGRYSTETAKPGLGFPERLEKPTHGGGRP